MLIEGIRQNLITEAKAFEKIGVATIREAEQIKESRRLPKLEDLVRFAVLIDMGIEVWQDCYYLTDDEIKDFFDRVLIKILVH